MQLDIAFGTKRMSSVNHKSSRLIFFPCFRALLAHFRTGRRGLRRIKEWSSAFAAEKVKLVVKSLAEGRIVYGNVPLINDWRKAMMTCHTELLQPDESDPLTVTEIRLLTS